MLAVAGAITGLYVLLPALAGLDTTWRRLGRGDPWWLSAAFGFEVLSFLCYVVFFRLAFSSGTAAISLRQSYRITMAGVMATRLFAAAGAGGVALTVWALRRMGMARREVATRTATFLVLLYAVFMAALLVDGLGLRAGLFSGPDPFGLTVVPAIFGALVIAAALLIALVSHDLDHALRAVGAARGRLARWSRALGTVPAVIGAGVNGAVALLRSADLRLLGAIGWWAFDVAVLWSCLKAFGDAPSIAVVVMAYFVGTLANVVPIPGGIGAVDGGMIGALIGFGVNGGLAIVAVLSYRAFAFWLPMIPGTVAYIQLVRDSRLGVAAAEPAPGA